MPKVRYRTYGHNGVELEMAYVSDNTEEPNVEGLVGEFCGRMPWNDAAACRDIVIYFSKAVTQGLENRAVRLARDPPPSDD